MRLTGAIAAARAQAELRARAPPDRVNLRYKGTALRYKVAPRSPASATGSGLIGTPSVTSGHGARGALPVYQGAPGDEHEVVTNTTCCTTTLQDGLIAGARRRGPHRGRRERLPDRLRRPRQPGAPRSPSVAGGACWAGGRALGAAKYEAIRFVGPLLGRPAVRRGAIRERAGNYREDAPGAQPCVVMGFHAPSIGRQATIVAADRAQRIGRGEVVESYPQPPRGP